MFIAVASTTTENRKKIELRFQEVIATRTIIWSRHVHEGKQGAGIQAAEKSRNRFCQDRPTTAHPFYNYTFILIAPLHVSVVKPPSSRDTKGHKHRFASNSHVILPWYFNCNDLSDSELSQTKTLVIS
jgi:hypothetical protein